MRVTKFWTRLKKMPVLPSKYCQMPWKNQKTITIVLLRQPEFENG